MALAVGIGEVGGEIFAMGTGGGDSDCDCVDGGGDDVGVAEAKGGEADGNLMWVGAFVTVMGETAIDAAVCVGVGLKRDGCFDGVVFEVEDGGEGEETILELIGGEVDAAVEVLDVWVEAGGFDLVESANASRSLVIDCMVIGMAG